jgi:hypothetical protein
LQKGKLSKGLKEVVVGWNLIRLITRGERKQKKTGCTALLDAAQPEEDIYQNTLYPKLT